MYLANGAHAVGRIVFSRRRESIGIWIGLVSLVAFALFEAVAVEGTRRLAMRALTQLPEVRGEALLEPLLRGTFTAMGFLLVLGSLTTAVSSLFLSDELPALFSLPVPRGRVLAKQLLTTVGASAAPALLIALPVLAVAAAAAPRPLLSLTVLLSSLFGVLALAGSLGTAGALLLVAWISPRRARVLAAALSAAGLFAALFGFRSARPERMLNPIEALETVERLSRVELPSPGANPAAWAGHASARALLGDPYALVPAAALALAGVLALTLVAFLLARKHFTLWQETREMDRGQGHARGGPSGSLSTALLRAEASSLLREASTPAQTGTLLAVFVLDLLNLWLMPAADAAARDLVSALQCGLSLFLVSALALRFAYPSVSSDGRAALVLRTLPLSPRRHLLARYVIRAVPSLVLSGALMAISLARLAPPRASVLLCVVLTLAGALAIPALQLGLGGLFPRYDAASAVSVALGPGGILALGLSTFLALTATVVASEELRGLLSSALGAPRLEAIPMLALWLAASGLAAVLPLVLAARSLEKSDLSAG
ncbi:MAG: hypothetical protein JNK60_05020 [Acidobacteria bacterium]|nr:hypothetical protein [Acidobacteriota bacterium]